MKRFHDAVALITGGGSGIGRATARQLAREGARVAVLDREEAAARETVQLTRLESAEALAVAVDVSQGPQVAEAVRQVTERWARIDILVNCAGVELALPLHETSEAQWDAVLEVNLKGVYLVCRAVLPGMMQRKAGAVVNISSISGMLGWPAYAAYCASKGGVLQLTRQMAVDYAPHNIRVNCVCPGTTLTPLVERLFEAESDPEAAKRRIAARHPLGRFAAPEEIAEAIVFLASEEASFITGAILPVDGGYTAK